MPELPDVELYLAALRPRILGARLERVRLASPFLLRSTDPPLAAVHGREVTALSRLGKRIVISLAGDLHLVLHLMIAGRLRWRKPGGTPASPGDATRSLAASRKRSAAIPRRLGLAAFDFSTGTLLVTEAGTKKRAALHVVAGAAGLAEHDPGGIEPLACDLGSFAAALRRENHTLKRALTDPRILSGIGNAYSDEILHRARLSPLARTGQLGDDVMERLFAATLEVLSEWTARLQREAGDAFPEKVTAFRPGMAVHGRYRQPCPVCGAPVQRILYAENEANYCPRCQTGGRLLADRALSRLLKGDWPRTLEELEARRRL